MKPNYSLIWIVLCLSIFLLFPNIRMLVYVIIGIFVLIVLLDALAARSLQAGQLSVYRNIATSLAIRCKSKVYLIVKNLHRKPCVLAIQDRCPLELYPQGSSAKANLNPREEFHLEYTIEPTMRGEFEFEFVDFQLTSPLGFWQRFFHVSCVDKVRVYPDFSQITKYLSFLLAHQTHQLGLKKQRRRGIGLDFHQLREYRQGDALNHIDWNATSRRRTLISREYQDEKEQHLLFMIDTGSRMHTDELGAALFDSALDGLLLLSYIALQQGDTVSVMCFGYTQRWIQSINGFSSIPRLLNHTYDIQTGAYASDYIAAAEETLARHRKRSMVLVLTCLRDDDADLPVALKLLSTRHTVVLANLYENVVDLVHSMEVKTEQQALTVLGLSKYIQQRSQVISKCEGSCNMVLESQPRDLPTHLVNAYWQLKRSGRF
ncbi:MAG: DUF58 domain-containing protein [Gammaproteobacteria bacterium]|nr:DUF58 domain-containing protein [Gammaproteobacteria bacterium]MDE0251730.1 DUF58 domain-containing protein [Gammaproteobacteria bacterium]MDE0403260.1 DUF58 domain-containing protein [Gammaproteobacteria bacterium]